MGDNIRTVEGYLQYCEGITAVLWEEASVLWGYFSTVEVVQYSVGDNIRTVGDSFSTVEGIQYIGG